MGRPGVVWKGSPLPAGHTCLPAVGKVIHCEGRVEAYGDAEVAEHALLLVLHQDVGAFDVPVGDGDFRPAAGGVVAVEVGHPAHQGARHLLQVHPAQDVAGKVVLEVAPAVVGGDQPVLPAGPRAPVLGGEEPQDAVVLEAGVGEDLALVLPGGVLLAGEDLHGHRLVLPRAAVAQLGPPHLRELPFAHHLVQLDGEQLGGAAAGAGGAGAGRALVHQHGQLLLPLGRPPGLWQRRWLSRFPSPRLGPLAPLLRAAEVKRHRDHHRHQQRRQEADGGHRDHLFALQHGVACREESKGEGAAAAGLQQLVFITRRRKICEAVNEAQPFAGPRCALRANPIRAKNPRCRRLLRGLLGLGLKFIKPGFRTLAGIAWAGPCGTRDPAAATRTARLPFGGSQAPLVLTVRGAGAEITAIKLGQGSSRANL